MAEDLTWDHLNDNRVALCANIRLLALRFFKVVHKKFSVMYSYFSPWELNFKQDRLKHLKQD